MQETNNDLEATERQSRIGFAAAIVGAMVVLGVVAYFFAARLADSRSEAGRHDNAAPEAETTGSVPVPVD